MSAASTADPGRSAAARANGNPRRQAGRTDAIELVVYANTIKHTELAAPTLDPVQHIDRAEAFVAATGAEIRHGGNRAFYSLTHDRIQMPPFETFRDAESYYATLLHELAHWTRHSSRLDRDFGRQKFGDEGYSREELVAELASSYGCADLEIALEPREDHAAYIESWLKVLNNDKRAIFSAAAHAQRTAD